MIKIGLMGGLGNQMFQYAYGRYKSIKTKDNLVLDINFYKEGNQPAELIRTFDLHVFKNINCEITCDGINCINGFFQRYDYVTEIRDILLNDFEIEAPSEYKKTLNKIENSDSVCLNVRRGDYVNFERSSSFHGFIDNTYFEKAIEELSKSVNNPKFFIFSDDIEWCIENIKTKNFECKFMTEEYYGPKFSLYLKFMSMCKHFILPNSTFGWWGAWLSKNPNKIVYTPKRWFLYNEAPEGLIPEQWSKL